MIANALMVGFGGALGAISRYLINELFYIYINQSSWTATLAINIIGCFFIGLFLGSYIPSRDATFYFFAIGFLGSFTTMSAFIHDMNKLLSENSIIFLVIYVIFNLLGSLIFYYLGTGLLR